MGRLIDRAVGDLAPGLILAPERYDPRRDGPGAATALLDWVEIAGGQIKGRPPDSPEQVRILDTSHVMGGLVPFPPAPAPWSAMGSAKRRLQPGDVVISRLRPYLGQVAWLDPGLFAADGLPIALLGSPELVILRPRQGSVAWLVPYLLCAPVQAALAAAQEGGHHPRVPAAWFAEHQLPADVLAEAASSAAVVEAAAAAVRGAVSHLQDHQGRMAERCFDLPRVTQARGGG